MTHELKIWPEYFLEVVAGRKNFEVRNNDRDYKVGDVLILKEFDPEAGEYTGLFIEKEVSYILEGGQFGIQKDIVIMSLKEVSRKFIYC